MKKPKTNEYWVEENGEGGSLMVTFSSKEYLAELEGEYPDDPPIAPTVLFTSRGKDKDFTIEQVREIGEHLIRIAEYFESEDE